LYISVTFINSYLGSSSTVKLTYELNTGLFEFLPEFGPSLVIGQYILLALDKKQDQKENVP
jgi:hypothetical protein